MSTCNAIRAVQLLLKLTVCAQREVSSRVLYAAKEPYGTDFRNSMAFNNSYDNGFVHGKTKDDTFTIYLRRKTKRNQTQRQGINAGEDKSKI